MIDATPLLRLYARSRLARLRAQDPATAQQRTLLDLVSGAAHTQFGRDHDFAGIRTVADYQARVPLRRYADFWKGYWSKAFPVLTDVTWAGRMPYFAFTSGTSAGSSKHIPVSKAMVAANRRAALDVLVHHVANRARSRVLAGPALILGGSTDLRTMEGGARQGDLSGIAAWEVPAWARPWTFPPPALALEADWEGKIDRLARAAPGHAIRSISGTPGWVMLFLERAGQIAGQPPAMLFPQLELYIHGGVAFGPYRARFAGLLAGCPAETREVYAASEGFIAVADRTPSDGMRLLLDNGLFFEFVPVDEVDAAAPARAWIADVATGTEYAMVLSSCAGLWSYVLGDTVRLVSRDPPRLVVTGRLSYMLNVFGEHLSGEQIEHAVLAAAAGRTVGEYAAGAIFPEGSSRGRHVFVVETAAAPAGFAPALDRALSAASLDYRERRAGDLGLDPPEVLAVPPGFFTEWMKSRGRLGGQNKVPRVINDAETLAGLVERARGVDGRVKPGHADKR
ncbi:MAG: GH3 auxin-responsive promoter family protein [Solirubrobacterales bacterium]